jgi:hypothetical protein
MRYFSGKICSENQYTHFMLRNFFSLENRAACKVMRKNILQPVGQHNTAHALCMLIPKATNTH